MDRKQIKTPQRATQTARAPRLINANEVFPWYREAFKGKINPYEIRFSMNDIDCNLLNIPTVKAIPTSYIHSLIVQPENAGDKSRVLSWLLRKWENESELFIAPTQYDDDLK